MATTAATSSVQEGSTLSAFLALIWISWKRQARARQMVWIALGLLVFSLVAVYLQTARDRWGMHHWRWPRGRDPKALTYLEAVNRLPLVLAVVQPNAPGQAVQHAVFGATRTILSPEARVSLPSTTDQPRYGDRLACSAFQVFSQAVVFSIFLTFLLPLWSLSFGTEALGGDRENQSLLWLLSRPIPRPLIYLAKFLALLPWCIGFNLGGFALICLMAGTPGRLALQLYWPAVALATLTFAALFLLIGAYFRRPAVIAIVYSFCLEVVLGNMPGYPKRVSVGFYARSLMYERAEDFGIQPDRPSVFLPVDGQTASLVLIGAALLLVGLGMWMFSRTQYHEVE